MRLMVSLSGWLHEQIRVAAFKEKVSMAEYVRRSVREKLKKEGKDA
jgi:predicted HicB family RNase H-like nuclease